MGPPKGLTSSQRLLAFTEFAAAYNVYLKGIGGVVLSAELRLAIAHCARDALLKCAGCNSLPKESCLQPGTDIYTLISNGIEHNESRILKKTSPSTVVYSMITSFVHTLINHQSRLNEQWYHQTIEALDKSELIPAVYVGERRLFYVLALFSEIVHVAGLSHSLNIFFVSVGQQVPPLPDQVDNPSEPSFFEWTKVLRKGRGLRYDKENTWSPFISTTDIDRDCLEFAKLALSTLDKQFLLSKMTISKVPWSCVPFSPADLVWYCRWSELSYYTDSMFNVLLPFVPLNPSVRCADSFSRYQVEIVASEVAAAHGCTF